MSDNARESEMGATSLESPPPTTGTTIRSRMATLRETLGFTQVSLSECIGVDPKTVRRWELGISTPSARYRRRLAEALGLSVFELAELLDESTGAVR
jgi:transcriptional regulator with XRE-family HTH domain